MRGKGCVESHVDATFVAHAAVFAERAGIQGGVVVGIVALHEGEGLPIAQAQLCFVDGGQCTALVDGRLSGHLEAVVQVHIVDADGGEPASAWVVPFVELFTGMEGAVEKVMNSC